MTGATRKRVLLAGGGSGLGRSILERLTEDGHDVDLTYCSSVPTFDPANAGVGAFHCDFAEAASVEALMKRIESMGAPYDALVYNPGAAYDCLVPYLDLGRARSIFDINFWGFVSLSKALAPAMMQRRAGRLVAIGSIAAGRGRRGNSVYGASKAAVEGFIRSAAQEMAPRGVTINLVAPGYVDTPMLEKYADRRDEMSKRIPARRLAKPTEVAAAVAFLLGPGADYVTGSSLVVDGGLSASF
jgi:NAD(P)-dependent dehydrogenase (short-subunit alcohol dehydrogenase family)